MALCTGGREWLDKYFLRGDPWVIHLEVVPNKPLKLQYCHILPKLQGINLHQANPGMRHLQKEIMKIKITHCTFLVENTQHRIDTDRVCLRTLL